MFYIIIIWDKKGAYSVSEKQKEILEIIKTFIEMIKREITDDSELESFLFYLSKIRNFCAHGNRLYCFKSKTPIPTVPLHSSLCLSVNSDNQYIQGKNDLFAVMIIFKLLLPDLTFKTFLKNLN